MVISLLADVNVEKHVLVVVAHLWEEPWREIAQALQLHLVSFADIGLNRADSDLIVWQRCQARDVVIITDNRNDDGPDSLESTIRRLNDANCLPVFNIADPERVLASGQYAARVAARLIEYLFDLEKVRGAGRIYLP